MAIKFHEEGAGRQNFRRRIIKQWIIEEIRKKHKEPGDINIIFTTDTYLRNLNREYLSRDYYTDIICFDYSEGNVLSGDLFISTERVSENSKKYREEYQKELFRVVIHGILHLAGYQDDNEQNAGIMREEENKSLKYLLKLIEQNQTLTGLR